jgi:hypothetical protein
MVSRRTDVDIMIWVVIVIDDGSNDSVGIGMLINIIMVIISIVAVVEFRVGSGVVVAVITREIDGSTLMIHRVIG